MTIDDLAVSLTNMVSEEDEGIQIPLSSTRHIVVMFKGKRYEISTVLMDRTGTVNIVVGCGAGEADPELLANIADDGWPGGQ